MWVEVSLEAGAQETERLASPASWPSLGTLRHVSETLSKVFSLVIFSQENPVSSISDLGSSDAASQSTLPRSLVVRNRARTNTRTRTQEPKVIQPNAPSKQPNIVQDRQALKSLLQVMLGYNIATHTFLSRSILL